MSKAEEYKYNCNCGEAIRFQSSQPGGAVEPLICEGCHEWHVVEMPEREEKHLYRYQENILMLRSEIVRTFADYREPMTVRQMFYRLLNKGHDKSEKFYNQVQRQMLKMRESGVLPFSMVADNTRSYYKPRTHSSLSSMLEESKYFYRRALWDDADAHVEIWLEKEALRGVFYPITKKYDVPLFVSKGCSSVTFIYDAAVDIRQREKPTFVYLFTDHDQYGHTISNSIEKRMREFGASDNAVFQRMALTPEQIREHDLPERPTKKNRHTKGWIGGSVELDALDPFILRQIVEGCITRHLDAYQLMKTQEIEEAEKQTLESIINNLGYA